MNKYKYILIICFIIAPFVLLSQDINTKAVSAFSKIEKGDYRSAIEILNNLITESPKAEFYLARAEAQFGLKNYNDAVANCNDAEKLKTNISSELQLRIFLVKDDFIRAEEMLKQNLNSSYKIPMYSLLNNADYNKLKSSDAFNNILNSGVYSKTEKQLYQVERLIYSGEYNQAYFLANEILSRNENIAQGWYFLSKINQNSGNEKQSLEAINKALELKKSIPDYYKQRALLLKDKGDYLQALNDVEKLIRLEPYMVDNYILKADLLFLNNKYSEALALIKLIESISDTNPDMLYLQSKANFENKDYLSALKNINQSLQIKQTREQYELRADIYIATNTYDFAIRDYSMVLDIDPYNGEIYAKKGLARYKSGDKEGACFDWEKGKRYGSYDAINYMDKYCK